MWWQRSNALSTSPCRDCCRMRLLPSELFCYSVAAVAAVHVVRKKTTTRASLKTSMTPTSLSTTQCLFQMSRSSSRCLFRLQLLPRLLPNARRHAICRLLTTRLQMWSSPPTTLCFNRRRLVSALKRRRKGKPLHRRHHPIQSVLQTLQCIARSSSRRTSSASETKRRRGGSQRHSHETLRRRLFSALSRRTSSVLGIRPTLGGCQGLERTSRTPDVALGDLWASR